MKKKKINGALLELELKRHNGCKTDFLPELGFPEMFLKLLVLISHICVW